MTRPIVLALVGLFAPAAAALLLAVAPALRRRGAPAAALTILGSVTSFVAALLLLADRLHGGPAALATVPWLRSGDTVIAEIGVCADGVSASMLVVVTLVALCVQVFSLGYMHDEQPPSFGRYFTYHALFLFSMNVLVLAPNLLQLFGGWELVGVTSYLLIGFYFRKPSAARAAVKAFWVTKFADMGLLFGLFVLFAATGSFRWDAQLAPAVATAVTLLFFLAVVGKSAQFPLHVWLPDAMEGPTPVSALLHAATMVAAGVFLIVRANPLFEQSETTRNVMLIVGAGTALFAACLALVQSDIKKVLAYSTCSQLGYMVAALGAGSMMGGFFHLTTHAFFKALLFLAAGSAIHAVHSNEIDDMGGLAKRMPWTGAAFVIGALALAGIPGFSGFFSKDLVLEAVEHRLGHVPWIALLGTAFLTAFYMGRVVVVAFFGAPSGEKAAHARDPGWSMRGPLVVLAALSLLGGAFTAPFARLHGEPYALHLGVGPVLAAALALGGFALAYRVYGADRRAAPAVLEGLAKVARSRAVNRFYEFGFHRVALVVSSGLAWTDRYLVDGLINMIGYETLEGGRRARPLQTGLAPDYVLAAVLGVVGLAAWAVAQ
ncbi:MAG: NADH-quinone oxidoreductase subunit L [Deltaproteobacteria bacterium]|jgi:NADH-quinone oxidoreductase subunit L|nr:NADH-quinone oxidoreductase subunit L [Deltaproteobacteria bacterium]